MKEKRANNFDQTVQIGCLPKTLTSLSLRNLKNLQVFMTPTKNFGIPNLSSSLLIVGLENTNFVAFPWCTATETQKNLLQRFTSLSLWANLSSSLMS